VPRTNTTAEAVARPPPHKRARLLKRPGMSTDPLGSAQSCVHAEGVDVCSRRLPERSAGTAGPVANETRRLKACSCTTSTPSACDLYSPCSGGVASLHRRLQTGTPSVCDGGVMSGGTCVLQRVVTGAMGQEGPLADARGSLADVWSEWVAERVVECVWWKGGWSKKAVRAKGYRRVPRLAVVCRRFALHTARPGHGGPKFCNDSF